jgi:hypothetical protein
VKTITMKKYFFAIFTMLMMNPSSADHRPQVESILRLEWDKLASKVSKTRPSLRWASRVAPPIPTSWPLEKNQFVVYAHARAMDLSTLRDGEHLGPVWGQVIFDLEASSAPKFELLSDKLAATGVVGVRPLTAPEIELLKLAPLELFVAPASSARDEKLRAYYGLSLQLGLLPREITARHPAFFNWLNCKG